MWSQISEHISQVTNQKFVGDRRTSVSGGCINQAFCFADSQHKYFVKTNTVLKASMFEAEAIALEQMSLTQTIRVPKVICLGIAEENSYIVMEWLELGGNREWQKLGENLAALHRVTSSQGFGWQQPNTIGETPQINNWESSWIEFWMEHRIKYQLKLARRKGFTCSVSETKLFETIPSFFQTYQPQPSLVHGDLWGGNVDFTKDGEPVIFDPALYYGDREVDIAMTELFGGFPASFYQAYNAILPLDSGYKYRKNLYNLYHILNHFNLFGGSYGAQANRMIEQICRAVI